MKIHKKEGIACVNPIDLGRSRQATKSRGSKDSAPRKSETFEDKKSNITLGIAAPYLQFRVLTYLKARGRLLDWWELGNLKAGKRGVQPVSVVFRPFILFASKYTTQNVSAQPECILMETVGPLFTTCTYSRYLVELPINPPSSTNSSQHCF
jgi:hypothetical protein